MGVLKGLGGEWPQPEHVKRKVEQAEQAWNDGLLCFVYKQIATSGLSEEGLNDALDGILRIGWVLHSTALSFNTVGMNKEVALFTFLRPWEDASSSTQDATPSP